MFLPNNICKNILFFVYYMYIYHTPIPYLPPILSYPYFKTLRRIDSTKKTNKQTKDTNNSPFETPTACQLTIWL